MRNYIMYFLFFALASTIFSCSQKESLPVKPYGIGQQIKEARMNTGVSQKDLAIAIGLSKENIQTIESGIAVPTRDIIVEIEETLGVEIVLDSNI